jgi:hypothetical protein
MFSMGGVPVAVFFVITASPLDTELRDNNALSLTTHTHTRARHCFGSPKSVDGGLVCTDICLSRSRESLAPSVLCLSGSSGAFASAMTRRSLSLSLPPRSLSFAYENDCIGVELAVPRPRLWIVCKSMRLVWPSNRTQLHRYQARERGGRGVGKKTRGRGGERGLEKEND